MDKIQSFQVATASSTTHCGCLPTWRDLEIIGNYRKLILNQLHLLPVQYRIQFKIFILTYKALHQLAPPYIQDMVRLRNGRPDLRSPVLTLHVQTPCLANYGGRSYFSCAPRLWNSLPEELRTQQDIRPFKRELKTFLLNQAILTCHFAWTSALKWH